MSQLVSQLYALQVKNTLLRLRNLASFFVELAFPVFICIFVAFLNEHADVIKTEEEVFEQEILSTMTRNMTYTPESAAASKLFSPGNRVLSLEQFKKMYPYVKEDDLIIVKLFFEDPNIVPKHLKFEIIAEDSYETKEKYVSVTGYSLHLPIAQTIVTQTFISHWAFETNLYNPVFQTLGFLQMPSLPHVIPPSENLHEFWQSFVGLLYFGLVCFTTKGIVEDKESKIKESMKLMGMSGIVYWLSWVLIGLQIGTIISLAFIFYMFYKGGDDSIFKSSPLLPSVVLILYVINNVTFACVISCFIQKARNAVFVSATIFIVTWFSSKLILEYLASRLITMAVGTIVPQVGFNIFLNNLLLLEQRDMEHRSVPTVDNNVTPHQTSLDGILLLMTNSLFNMLFVWYVDNVNPGEFGIPQPYYFFITKDYWYPSPKPLADMADLPKKDDRLFEAPSSDLKIGVMVRDLVKVFGRHVAVAGTSMDLYQDQISVLLGHNGAGKTTTISMITGFLKPTSGTVVINGYDISKNLSQARSSLGLCPQHDVLFSKLTCKDHLAFFLRMRGQYHPTSKYEIEGMLSKVGLAQRMSTYAANLSSSQKRKLSVVCSFIGNIKTVFLDEPSSGLDPSARRELWDFLKGMRHGRTILLTTHYMDEADVLGDQIMIMAEGVVKCGGTPMFLKQIYGTGYQMNIVKTEKCYARTVTTLVQKLIPTAKFTGETPNEIYYILPDDKGQLLPKLFAEMEKNKRYLNISSFGITATSMEDVFIRVGEGQEPKTFVAQESVKSEPSERFSLFKDDASHFSERLDEVRKSVGSKLDDADEMTFRRTSKMEQERKSQILARFETMKNYKRNKGGALFVQQMRAILIKRLILFKRNIGSAIFLLLLPVSLTMLGASYDKSLIEGDASSAIYFSLDGFKDLIVPVFSRTMRTNSITQFYKNQFSNSTGTKFVESNKTTTDSINEFLINWGQANGKRIYQNQMLVGAVFEDEHYTILYQKSALLAKGISTQLLMNAWAQSILGSEFSVQLGVHHRPRMKRIKKNDLQLPTMFCLGFAMALIPVVSIHNLIAERMVGAKHLQSLSGVSTVAYWLGTYLFDLFFFLIVIATVMLGLSIHPDIFLARGRWSVTLFILISFAVAMFPYLYAVQIIFKNPANGVISILCFNVFVGVLIAVMLTMFKVNNEDSLLHQVDVILAPLSPNYVLTACQCLFIIVVLQKSKVDVPFTSYLTDESVGESLLSKLMLFAVHFVGGWVFVALVEFRVDRMLWYMCGRGLPSSVMKSNLPSNRHLSEDDDVKEESYIVNETPLDILCQSNAIILKNLRKIFCVNCSLSPLVAVRGTSLAVPQNECLGLLGQNGAGKTTTFKMLTGDNMVTSGDAYLNGLSVKTQTKHVQALMGYCPQQDALHDKLTGRETLYLYARLRGVPEINVRDVTETIIDFVTLRPHEDKITGKYSRGNKRKLSVGISIIGDPLFIMLDEPTAGMDPVARRTLWTILHMIRSSGRTLVLATHSIEECEALCTRIAIMAKGRLLCLGSPQHLKNKFGQGYTVVMRASVNQHGKVLPLTEPQAFVVQAFPNTQVFATQEAYVHLQVPDTVLLSSLFSTLEQAKHKFKFQYYTVQQTTLEQVFLMLMKETFV